MPRLSRAILLAAALAGLAAGCRKAAPTGPSEPPPAAATITLTPGGAAPRDVVIALGDRVRFVNQDSHTHNVASDPHPEHDECPSVNQAGFLLPGQSRDTGNFVIARVCGFHDHDDPDNQKWRGSITTR
jgi:plastocyanin